MLVCDECSCGKRYPDTHSQDVATTDSSARMQTVPLALGKRTADRTAGRTLGAAAPAAVATLAGAGRCSARAICLALRAAAAAKGWRLMERGARAPTISSAEAPLFNLFVSI